MDFLFKHDVLNENLEALWKSRDWRFPILSVGFTKRLDCLELKEGLKAKRSVCGSRQEEPRLNVSPVVANIQGLLEIGKMINRLNDIYILQPSEIFQEIHQYKKVNSSNLIERICLYVRPPSQG